MTNSTDSTVWIPLTRGARTIIDAADYDLVKGHSWYAHPRTEKPEVLYARALISGRLVFMHQLILKAPKGFVTGHRDRDTLNNRRGNLRVLTRRQNISKERNENPFPGAYIGPRGWYSTIRIDGRSTYLGMFNSREEASAAYVQASLKHHGEFSPFAEMGA